MSEIPVQRDFRVSNKVCKSMQSNMKAMADEIRYNKLRKKNRHGGQAADRMELLHKHSKGA